MARTAYSRKEAYDNIAVGSAITSQEQVLPGTTAAGTTPPDVDRVTYAHGENLVAVASDTLIENIPAVATNPPDEKIAI